MYKDQLRLITDKIGIRDILDILAEIIEEDIEDGRSILWQYNGAWEIDSYEANIAAENIRKPMF